MPTSQATKLINAVTATLWIRIKLISTETVHQILTSMKDYVIVSDPTKWLKKMHDFVGTISVERHPTKHITKSESAMCP